MVDAELSRGEPSPVAGFAQPAGAALAPVARQIQQVKTQAQSGGLALDDGAARQLMADLSSVQAQVRQLIVDVADGLDVPLRLGDNIIGRTMAERLRGAAAGNPGAVLPVLEQFSEVVAELEDIVRAADRTYTETDESAAQSTRDIGRALDGGF
ncbi:hypothetical protein SAMN05216266_103261 [Amycolatopsis marina]|uniref:Excreted virulence factor EspC, type VII ESX diderm n=1 Tax=Amycolatopsis marina TaxID=490629 RepID=A0A1I0XJ75_9PSEU|nr:hypothetical protein [Amycolatopsis marina]SFB01075.1 hypothetical protein SAMN05216266_103261 [Amycolatopsis marina]